MTRKRLHLNINIYTSGAFASAWRYRTGHPGAFMDVDFHIKVSQLAEKACFDAVFLADSPAVSSDLSTSPTLALDPLITMAGIAARTERIGLVASSSTTYNEPYNVARQFASLDHASGGRVGWNIVTSASLEAGGNFGSGLVPHAMRYARADEFTRVVKALWQSWGEGAFTGDKGSGLFADVSRIRPINHAGEHFSVAGPFQLPQSPQGHPVVVQAGGSEPGRVLATNHADVIFSLANSLDEGIAFAKDIRARVAHTASRSGKILILPGLETVIGSTEEESRRREDELWDMLPAHHNIFRLAYLLDIDPATIEPDRPLPDNLRIREDGSHTFAQSAVTVASGAKRTFRDALRALGSGTGHRVVVGTPEQVANDMESWLDAGAADGFNLMPDVLPDGLEAFVSNVMPILRQRGIFRSEYSGTTLRDHYGLSRPSES